MNKVVKNHWNSLKKGSGSGIILLDLIVLCSGQNSEACLFVSTFYIFVSVVHGFYR
jgi:hypothetical protein